MADDNKNEGGRPPFEPTEDQRKQVKVLAGFGLVQAQICLLITNPQTGKPISEPTLRKHFEEELAIGTAQGDSQVLQSLFFQAVGRGKQYDEENRVVREEMKPIVAATIFSCKARPGIKMTERMEFTGKNGAPLIPDMEKMVAKLTPEQLELVERVQNLFATLAAGGDPSDPGQAGNPQTAH